MTHATQYARDRFTRSLSTLCSRLDNKSSDEFDYASPRGALLQVTGRLRVNARVLWAFGSWAHGAPECSDLDLAMDIRDEWVDGFGRLAGGGRARARPGFDTARKAILTAPPLVHILDAAFIREHGPTGDCAVHPDTMVPIWLAPDLSDQERALYGLASHLVGDGDWRDRIANIKARPDFERVPRLLDALPLRIEQTGMDLRRAEEAIRAHALGLISWEFVPHGAKRAEEAELTRAERAATTRHDTQDLAQISRVIAGTRSLRKQYPGALFWYGNQCGVWARMFESWKAECFVITPRWSAQGPNGSLVVTKGPNYSEAAVESFEQAERDTISVTNNVYRP